MTDPVRRLLRTPHGAAGLVMGCLVAPAGAIALTAIGFNLLGDGLRDALNPRDER